MQGGASFRTLEKRKQMTQFFDKVLFHHLVTAGNCYKIRPDDDDGWGKITPLCREYSNFRSYPKTRASAAFPAGTIVGPVIEVHIVKVLDILQRSCNSINYKPRIHNLRSYIQRRAFCE